MQRRRRLPFLRILGGLATALVATTAGAGDLTTPSDPQAIIGGAPSAACAWPSTVFLENCTGTLIHPEIVVYAAHCGEPERVWFGESIENGVVIPADGFSVDTEYCWTNPAHATENDIGPGRAADFAFCKLATPVLDVPIVPPLMGCERTALTSGTEVTLVGFGGTDQETFGVKYQVDTVLHYIDDHGAAVIGGGGQSPCGGDSGGPAFVQMPDGTWRAFGIVGGPNVGNCGDAMWFATIHTAVPHIERVSGIDVSACHHSYGQWNPSPNCQQFPLDPGNGEGRSWANGCSGGPVSDWSATCGPPFDDSEDLEGPVTAITSPEDRTRFDRLPDQPAYSLVATADATDLPSGVARLELVINGTVVDGSRLLGPPWEWELDLPVGVWEMQALAQDWAGHEVYSEAVVVGVDRDPPPAEDPSTSTGAEDDGSTSDGSTSGTSDPFTTGDATAATGTDADPDAANPGNGGCGCHAGTNGSLAGWLPVLLVPAFLRRRTRRRRSPRWWLPVTLLVACSDDPGTSDDDGPTEPSTTSTGSTTTDASTTRGTDSTGDPGTSTGEPSASTGGMPICEVGTADCTCTEDYACDDGLACYLNTCVPCQAGTITCPCREPTEDVAACDEGLFCFGGNCSSPQPCPFLENGVCNEPEGNDQCLEGTDYFDCCPTQPDVCEEVHAGGSCPDGSDPNDCAPDTGDSTGTGTSTRAEDSTSTGDDSTTTTD